MAMQVCSGAIMRCTYGAAPSSLGVLPLNQVMTGSPAANIMDFKPLVNVMPFGLCSSLMNPTVAAATAAAMGVLTPMPCVPATCMPWKGGNPVVLIANFPAVTSDSMLSCMWGGEISIVMAGQLIVVE